MLRALRWLWQYVGFHTFVTGSEGTLLTFGEGGGAPPGRPYVAPVVVYGRDGKVTSYEVDEPDTTDRCWASNNSYCAIANRAAPVEWAP